MVLTTIISGGEYVSVPEAARRKRVTRGGVWAAIKRGELRARRVGRVWYIPVEAIRAWKPRHWGKNADVKAEA